MFQLEKKITMGILPDKFHQLIQTNSPKVTNGKIIPYKEGFHLRLGL